MHHSLVKHKNHINHYDETKYWLILQTLPARVKENHYLNHGGPSANPLVKSFMNIESEA